MSTGTINQDDLPTSEQLATILSELSNVIEEMAQGVLVKTYDDGKVVDDHRTPNLDRLLALLGAAMRDGYPTRSMSDHQPVTVRDDAGESMPPVSDPTGELAVADSKIVDPIRESARTVLNGLTHALGDLRIVRGAMIELFEKDQLHPAEPGCSSHARIDTWEVIVKAGRCRWCYDFWHHYRVDPPKELLEWRAEGRRITQTMIDVALNIGRSKGKRKRRSR